MKDPIIVVHGGAGEWPLPRQKMGIKGVRNAAAAGLHALTTGGSAIEAVETAVASMENDRVFNAGTGSALNLLGEVEADAAIMDGRSLHAGGVAMVKDVLNPIKLARIVMEKTDHVLIAGRGAALLAEAFRVPRGNLAVRNRVSTWKREKAAFKQGKLGHLSKNYHTYLERRLASALDTVGALAMDKQGSTAAGCSTGGLALKFPGRIGDSAIIGAGLYADNRLGAATATGIGEYAIRLGISKLACDLMKRVSAPVAAQNSVRVLSSRIGRGLGVITLDRRGRYGAAHNTPHLCWGVAYGQAKPKVGILGTRF